MADSGSSSEAQLAERKRETLADILERKKMDVRHPTLAD
jgi:hypothetical protein